MPDEPTSPPPSRGPGVIGWLWRPALVLVVAGLMAWWILGVDTGPRGEAPPPSDPPAQAAPAPTAAEPRAWRPRPTVEPAPGCAPRAERRCVDGDAWWVDGCGVTYAEAEECGARLCRDGACEPPPPAACGGEPLLGRCDGDVARGCEGGHPYAIDCAALGRRCQTTEDGPACLPIAEDLCNPLTEPPRCDGDTLISCWQGTPQRVDCRTFGALCGRPSGTGAAACLQPRPPVPDEACDDPCGCPPPPTDEVCDGRDNDQDGWIDESGSCPPIDLVVFVIVDADGEGSYEREEIDAEVARLAQWFAREDDDGLSFRLAEVVRIAEPAWLQLEDDELDAVLRSSVITAAREDFYVPIVLTERLWVDGVPRPGLATVPNGTCGGQRRFAEPQPLRGLVALGKRRWPSTLAHELGHYLGLCHTHADHPAPLVTVDARGVEDPMTAPACTEACARDDDGVCDTPPDPGPTTCHLDAACSVTCDDGSTPDPGNMMGYYPDCRTGFTEQQARLMRQALASRRAWHRCTGPQGCACAVGAGDCPEQMSCRIYRGEGGRSDDGESTFGRCTLDGPAVPGGVCVGSLDCSAGAQCIRQPDAEARCVRPCDDETTSCRCAEVDGVSHPICIDDLQHDPP